MAKGGSSQPVKQEITQSSLPEYARPYFEGMMARANTALTTPYQTYGQERIAGFTPQQQQLQQNILNQQTPGEFGQAGNLASLAGQRSLDFANYDTGQFNAQQIGMPNLQQYSMGRTRDVQAQQYDTPQMQAAQTGYQPNLNYFQMQAPQQFGTAQAQQYMSPFAEAVMEPQKREAITSARRSQVAQDLGSARQGTYGGSRQLLASMERERNLGQQLGDIDVRGRQAAFENAQQQFERDRAAGMTAGQQNLQAQLGVQQLGTQTGMQAALANLDAASQANVQNMAAKLQTQGLNADQAMRAALANQQSDITRGTQDLSAALETQRLGATTGLEALRANQTADLERQRMREQSRQFGAGQGLAALGQAGQMGQTLTNIGSARSQADLARFGQQTQTAAQKQALDQQFMDMHYQDFLRQQGYPMEQLQQYSSLLRGVPVTPNMTSTAYAPSASLGSQLMGGGLAAAGIYNTFRGG
jgi:hypothetical protein